LPIVHRRLPLTRSQATQSSMYIFTLSILRHLRHSRLLASISIFLARKACSADPKGPCYTFRSFAMYQPMPGAGESGHYRPPPTTSLFPGPRPTTPPNLNSPIDTPAQPRKSPGRSFSLSLKSKGKLPIRTGLHDRRWDLDFGKRAANPSAGSGSGEPSASGRSRQVRPDTAPSPTSPDSLRRTMSSEGSRSARSSLSRSTPPPHPPPKDPIPQRPPDAEAALLQSVRMKMSSQDQEAMRKIRLTMDMSTSDTGSSNSSLKSPVYSGSGQGSASSTSHGHGRPTVGSRRSTLSRQITSEDLDDPLPTDDQRVSP
jgi:hypothetical protein